MPVLAIGENESSILKIREMPTTKISRGDVAVSGRRFPWLRARIQVPAGSEGSADLVKRLHPVEVIPRFDSGWVDLSVICAPIIAIESLCGRAK